MNNRFLLILLASIAILFGVFFFTRDDKQAGDTSANASNHIVGKADSKVTLIEYGDFQCPACAQYFPVMAQIKQNYKDKIVFQHRHFPLVQIHANAMLAARSAEAAGKQGKFWEMHDLLYSQQNVWKDSTNASAIFADYATQLELNVDEFKAYAADQASLDTVNADIREGQKLKINSTPSFILNGTKIENPPQTYEDFAKLIDAEIQKAGQ